MPIPIDSEHIQHVSSNVVFLLAERIVDVAPIIDAIIATVPNPEPGRDAEILSFPAQLSVIIQDPNRIMVKEHTGQFPLREDFAETVSQLMSATADATHMNIPSWGLNVEFLYHDLDISNAAEAIAQRNLQQRILANPEFRLTGGAIKLWTERKGVRYQLNLEPAGDQHATSVFRAKGNIHHRQDAVPSGKLLHEQVKDGLDNTLLIYSLLLGEPTKS